MNNVIIINKALETTEGILYQLKILAKQTREYPSLADTEFLKNEIKSNIETLTKQITIISQ